MTGDPLVASYQANLVDDSAAADSDAVSVAVIGAWIVRTIDLVIATAALIVLAPVLLGLSVALWMQDGGAPIFVHWRIGKGGIPFPCLKLRTMVVDSEHRLKEHLETNAAAAQEWAQDRKLRDDPRVTPLGSFLRKSSLDEIPQLLNVLYGQMSLVGPRPIVAAEIPRYGRYFREYCRVRPGITGLWQVSGRNAVSYQRRVALDTVYARNKSLAVDLFILGRTIPAVVSGRGCS
ncbi:sugar transferase [Sphingosinicellaceae bacterium]|nr:sugar transferase [Sphingosinicellaceae bacterium]